MFKRILLLGLVLMFCTSDSQALNLSRVKTWGAEVLTHGDLNAEFDNILNHSITNSDISASAAIVGSKLDLAIPGAIGATTPAAGTFTNLTINGNTIIGDAAADTTHFNSNTIDFEGATADAFETLLVITDPTADRNLTVPNASSVTLPTGAVFFMVTGSCPAGTTDVSATYSNKFIKINATAGTSAGTVFTNTSDSTTLTAAQSGLPAHTHTHNGIVEAAGGLKGGSSFGNNTDGVTGSTGGTSAASGHTHTSSTATTLEPSSITMILCQVS